MSIFEFKSLRQRPNIWASTINRVDLVMARPSNIEAASSAKPRVLIIGRYSGNHQLIHLALKDGFEVDSAYSGFLALTLLGERSYDLIIAAVDLPREYRGERIVKAVRKVDGYAETPIVALVSEGVKEPKGGHTAGAKAQGFDACLIHPTEFGSVQLSVDAALGRQARNAA